MTTISPSIFVKESISKEVLRLINSKTGVNVRDGVEMILKNDLNGNGNNGTSNDDKSIDVGDILRQGLSFLALCPFDTLDIPLNADANQIRKAYKKMALKYHPDKNPVTTPLFQAIHSAYEKLSNESMKNEFQTSTADSTPTPPTTSKPPEGSPPKKENTNENKKESQSSSNENHTNNQKTNETKKNKAREKEKEEMKAFAESQQRTKMKERMRQEEERKKKEEEQQKVETEEEKIQREREEGRKKEMEEAEHRAAERRAKTGYGTHQTYYQRENIQRKERSSNGEEYSHQPPLNHHQNHQNQNNNTNAQTNTQTNTADTSPKSNVPTIPTPIGLTGIAVDIGTVQLQWTPLSQWDPPPEVITKYNVELSWREVLVANPSGFGQIDQSDAQWEIGSLMITGDKVMKRNLTPGSTYEFSIRYRTSASIDKKQQGNSMSTSSWGYWCPEITVSIPYGRASSRGGTKPNSSQGNRPSSTSNSNSNSNANSSSRRKSNPDVGDHVPSMSSTQTSTSKPTTQNPTKPNPSSSNSTSTSTSSSNPNPKQKLKPKQPSASASSTPTASSSTTTSAQPRNFDFDSANFPATNRPKYHENPELFEDDESSKLNLHQSQQNGHHESNDIHNNPSSSLYHKYYGSAKSLPEENNCDSIFEDEGIVPDVWVEEESSDDDSPQKSTAKQTMKTKWYQLIPPDSHIGSGRYVHSVHLLKDDASQTIGYISTAKKVLASKRLSDWMFVKTHWNTLKNSNDIAANMNESNSTNTPWGWVKRCAWNERLGRDHVFFHPVPKSVVSGLKYPTTKLTPNEDDDHDHDFGENDTLDGSGVDSQEYHQNLFSEDDEFEMNEELFREKMSKSFKKLASVPIWYEQFDENGYPYYYNPKTGESKWEPPEWVEDIDPSSGARYFVKLDRQNAAPLKSTWSMPQSFARLVRQQQFS